MTHIQNLLYPWHIQNSDIFKSSRVSRSLSDMFQAIIIFARSSFLDHFKCLSRFQIRLCIHKRYYVYTVILGSVSGIFRHIQASPEACVSLQYSEPWHIPITKHFQTLWYIHNTILNIFAKAPSWTFDTVLNVPLFFRCYLTSRVSLMLYFRHIQVYSILIQPCLGTLTYLGTFCFSHTQTFLNATQNLSEDLSILRFPAYVGTLCFRHVQPCSQR